MDGHGSGVDSIFVSCPTLLTGASEILLTTRESPRSSFVGCNTTCDRTAEHAEPWRSMTHEKET